MIAAGRTVLLCGALISSLASLLSAADTLPKKQYVVDVWLGNSAPTVVIEEGGKAVVQIGDDERLKLEVTARTRNVQKPDRQFFDITYTDASKPEMPVVITWKMALPDKAQAIADYGWKKGCIFGVSVKRRAESDKLDPAEKQ